MEYIPNNNAVIDDLNNENIRNIYTQGSEIKNNNKINNKNEKNIHTNHTNKDSPKKVNSKDSLKQSNKKEKKSKKIKSHKNLSKTTKKDKNVNRKNVEENNNIEKKELFLSTSKKKKRNKSQIIIKKTEEISTNLTEKITKLVNKNKSRNINNKNIINEFKDIKKDLNNDISEKNLFKSVDQDTKILQKEEKSSELSEDNFSPDDFKYFGVLGEGEFGKIYLAKWINKDNLYYSMKIETFSTKEEVLKSQSITKIVKNFIKKTNSRGVIQIYGDVWKKINNIYNYYVLMERAERDMEQELIIRCNSLTFYTENDLINVLCQLIIVCSLMQKNNIAHRDIKPQNILIIKGVYKLCDFGEAIVFEKDEDNPQNIKGTELYMSPILFYGLRYKYKQVKHNAYKSDVFSLGLCILLAATLNYDCLCQIRELTDMNQIKNIILYYLSNRYSLNFITFLLKMLEVNENNRPDFIQLERMLIKKQ